MKTETDDDQTIEISDDDGEPENVNTKTEDVTNEEEERNLEPRREVRTRSGRVSRKPKRFEEYETF